MDIRLKQHATEIAGQVLEALNKYPELIRRILTDTSLHRVQPSRYDANPINYRADSDTRYADPAKRIGVYYLGFTEEVAVAESFQPGQGVDDQAVRLSYLEQTSLHLLKAARDLQVVDVAALANRATHHKLRDIVQAKGQGRLGYALTQQFSQACMQRARLSLPHCQGIPIVALDDLQRLAVVQQFETRHLIARLTRI
ncbi:RES domain-containing protein [Pseudomonas sp. NPDC089752]|uniref:RES domain-containing protein n=1 Tax=Pseudomonas sp. NPDC089752 TaxID=3364472 RepID=UPI00382927FD